MKYSKKGMRHYGSDRTALQLSQLAEAYYTETDPLNIWEYTINGMTVYDITGCDEAYALTADQVNAYLETMANETCFSN